MNIEIAFGWWLLPAGVTVAALIWHWWAAPDDTGSIGSAVTGAFTFLVALVAALIAWLVWALLT